LSEAAKTLPPGLATSIMFSASPREPEQAAVGHSALDWRAARPAACPRSPALIRGCGAPSGRPGRRWQPWGRCPSRAGADRSFRGQGAMLGSTRNDSKPDRGAAPY